MNFLLKIRLGSVFAYLFFYLCWGNKKIDTSCEIGYFDNLSEVKHE
jgi:hypothetical protein